MPDFGIFRGFNLDLFGDRLYAGQLPTKLGSIGSFDFGFDVDALAFFNRVEAAGGSLSTLEKNAVNNLVISLKGYYIWAKLKAIYPMVGASNASCRQNLKSSNFTGTFSSGWTFASTGATPNGTSAFMNTGIVPSVDLARDNISIGVYSGTVTSQDKPAMGSNNSSSYLRLYPNHPTNLLFADMNDGSFTLVASENRGDGFIFAYRTASNQKKISRRGTILALNENSNGINALPIYLGATNSNGTAALFSNFQHRFSFAGEGFTDAEAANLHLAVQAFQTTLGRQI